VRRLIKILAIIYLAYLAIMVLVVNPALNILPPGYVKDYTGRELQADLILLNPFTLSLDTGKLALPDPDGSQFVSLESATINLSMASIWHPGIVFDQVAVQGLNVHVKQAADGSFNFSDLIPPEDPDATPEPAGAPGITIDQLNFHSETLMFSSAAREKPYSSQLDQLAINIEGLSTVLEEGKPYRLDARGPGGGELHWEGEVSIPRGHSAGTLRLTEIQLPRLWSIAEPWVNFEVVDGTLSVDGHYELNWQDELSYRVSKGKISIDGVDLQPKEPAALADTSLSLARLALADIELDGQAQHAAVASLAIDELAISGWSEGSEASLTQLFAVNLPAGDEPPAADASSDEAGWTAQLQQFQLANSSVRWRSEFTDPGQLDVTPISASASAITWPLAGDSELSLALTINGQTSASVDGSLDLGSGDGQLSYKLEALPLPWFNPNLPAALKAKVSSGQLGVAGAIGLAGFTPTQISADGAITGFSGEMTETETSLTAWETVRWEKLLVDLDKQRVELARLSIDNYIGRIHINEDGSINAQNAWQAELAADDGAVQQEQTEPEGEPWSVSVPMIHITDSEIDFKDESLPIKFGTVIGDINGDITGLSSQPDAPTRVDIKGSVDGYAPVLLAGTAEPLRSPPAIDLGLDFDGVDMAMLSPYSGTYAGYAIESGVLTLHLKYALRDNRLAGNNKVLIKQMKLGDKVDSDKAADLPLELALSLLTDSNGVIDMEVPVSGNVNDPQFSVGSVVMGAFMNLITKAVTAPFTLLASLVDSEDDLQRLNFTSGSADLTAPTTAKLDELSEALSQRPALGLEVIGRLQPRADRERLQKNQLGAELMAAGLSEQELDSKGPGWEEAIRSRYQDQLGDPAALTIREQYLALAGQVALPEDALLDLARQRAVAVKTYLVNSAGMAADRVVIGQPSLDPASNLYSGVELAVET
jgi:uncharacterized protein involved in outer membrane biogenesis/outer membrane protein OmpA-like peptidoglycan-associated protein